MQIGDEFDPRFSVCKFHPDAIVSADRSLVSGIDKRLYDLLIVYRHRGGQVFPGIETLAKELAVSEKTIRRSLKALAAAGLISWVKAGRSNLYSFLFHRIFVDAAREAGIAVPDTTPVTESGHRSNSSPIPVKKAPDTGHSCDRLSTEVHEVQTNEERKLVTNTGRAGTDKPPADAFIEQIRSIIDLADILGRKPDDALCRKVIGILGYPAAIPFLKSQMRDAREGEIRSYGLVASLAKDARGVYDVDKKRRLEEAKRRADQEPAHEAQVRSWLQPLGFTEQYLERAVRLIMAPEVCKDLASGEVQKKLRSVQLHAEQGHERSLLARFARESSFKVNGKPPARSRVSVPEILDRIRYEFRVRNLADRLGNLPQAPDRRTEIRQLVEAFMGRAPIPDDLLGRLVEMAGLRTVPDLIGCLEDLEWEAPIVAKQWRGLIQGFCPKCKGKGWRFPDLERRINHLGGYAEQDCPECIPVWSVMDPAM